MLRYIITGFAIGSLAALSNAQQSDRGVLPQVQQQNQQQSQAHCPL